ncbi:MbtH family protein [Nocardiopsis salina]|uniref:MbtH family protein n=1 Tax=Nocardiopsis salina TaxID=245836 RepID=UPI00034B1DBB|nr:MbtH family protein [Nocardiopsis salina]
MTNPFDTTDGSFLVLVNDDGQHSLWPGFLPVPTGWAVIHGPDDKQPCLDFIDQNWTDLRPRRRRELDRC